MKVLILGCGYTGSWLARFLVQQNIAVTVTTRDGTTADDLQVDCYPFRYESTETLALLPLEALAGVTHVLNSIPPNHQGVDPVVACLIPALETLELQWFGYLSTTGVYGDAKGAWVDETTPLHPQNKRSLHRVAAERAFLNSKLPTHIFRLPGIYGPGRSIFDRMAAGTAKRVHRPGHVFCRIHVEDILRTLWASMQQPHPPVIYNVCDDQPTEPSNLIVEAAQLLGIAPPEAISFEEVQMTAISASFWRESRKVSNQKIKTELGIRLQYPTYRQGLKAIHELR